MMRVLLTGGSGFLGYHIAEDLTRSTDWEVVALTRLSPGRLANLTRTARVRTVCHDFRAELSPAVLAEIGQVDVVVHAGAQVHALASLADPAVSVRANVIGTFNMLEAARRLKAARFVYVSTAEVFGPTPPGVFFGEDDALNPSTPYAATKAGGEALVWSYGRSFGLNTLVLRTMNLYGEWQQAARFTPMVVLKILCDETIDIHAYPDGQPGTRQWLYAPECARALRFLIGAGVPGEVYHVVGEEHSNLEVAQRVADLLGRPARLNIVDVGATHRAHDLRYAVSAEKLGRLGWKPAEDFATSFARTVRWLEEHQAWLEAGQ